MTRMFLTCIAGIVIGSLAQSAVSWSEEFPLDQIAGIVAPNTLPTPLPEGKANQIVVYSANWCTPCQRLKPVLLSLSQEGYKVVHRDVDKDGDKLEYSFVTLPTIYFLRDEMVIKKDTGFRSKEYIKRTLIRECRLTSNAVAISGGANCRPPSSPR